MPHPRISSEINEALRDAGLEAYQSGVASLLQISQDYYTKRSVSDRSRQLFEGLAEIEELEA